MAETRRFELLKGLTPYLVSSEDCEVALTPIYACLDSLQCIYIVQIPATKANSWAKHGQKKSRPISQSGNTIYIWGKPDLVSSFP